MPYNVLSQDLAETAPVTTLGAPLTEVGMTLAEMQDELDAMLGRRADIVPERFALWLNQSYTDICTSLDIDELKGGLGLLMIADQPLYLLPYAVSTIMGAAMVLPTSVRISGGYPLDKTDLTTYRSLEAEGDDPRMFFRLNNMLVVWPTPDEARTLALDVRIRPQWLAATTDSPILGTEWHEGILLGARQRGFAALMEYDKAASAGNEFVTFMRRRTDREAKETEGRVIGSSAPQRMGSIRNRTLRPRYDGRET